MEDRGMGNGHANCRPPVIARESMAAVMGGFIEQKGKILDALAVSPTDPLVAIVEFEGRGPWALIPPTPTR